VRYLNAQAQEILKDPRRRSARARLGEQLASKIEYMVAEASLEPGTPLVERALAERFMVSRSPVRDALRVLAERGTVGPRPEGGRQAMSRRASLDDRALSPP
jgi:DNA-binding GntR family transcriptional regulator